MSTFAPSTFAIVLLLGGCASGPGSGNQPETPLWDDADLDGDGLSNAQEQALGTDLSRSDTDSDGWDDGEEVASFTDPLSDADHPYTGGWPIGACRHDIVPEGYGEGDLVAAIELEDQHGETVRIHDFCDRAVLVITAYQWHGGSLADSMAKQELYAKYEERGLMVIALLGENDYGGAPGIMDLREFADDLGITYPVVSDRDFSTGMAFSAGAVILPPSESLVDVGGEVVFADRRGDTEGQIEPYLPW